MVYKNFLLLATFASFKIVFPKLRGQKVAGAKHFFLTIFGHFLGGTGKEKFFLKNFDFRKSYAIFFIFIKLY